MYLRPLQSQIEGKSQLNGDVAQSVEQRTENPCVGGSIPFITTGLSDFSVSMTILIKSLQNHNGLGGFLCKKSASSVIQRSDRIKLPSCG